MAYGGRAAGETSPLLRHGSNVADVGSSKTNSTERSNAGFTQWMSTLLSRLHFDTVAPQYKFVPLLGCLMILTNEGEFFFKQAATLRAVESLYCIEYYNVHDPSLVSRWGKHIPERLCKAGEIETNVAKTWAWVMLARMLSALIATVPLGRLADKKSRRLVMVLHKLSAVVSSTWQLIVYLAYPKLPIWSIYFGGLAALFGGNFDVGLAVLFASYTDVLTDANQRTTLFFITTAMQYVGQAFFPPIGGLLLNLDGQGGTPVVAMVVGIGAGLISLAIAGLLFPETRGARKATGGLQYDCRAEQDGVIEREADEAEDRQRSGAVAKGKLTGALAKLRKGAEGVGIVRSLALGLALFFVSVGIKAIDWFGLLQYPVIRLNWTYTKASILPSIQALITMTLFFILLPASTHLLTRRQKLSARASALVIMAASIAFLTTGAVLMGFASTAPFFILSMIVYTLGAGFGVTAQSYLADCVPEARLASVLAVLSIAAVVGKVGASVLWPPLVDASLKLGTEVGKGLPMFAAAIGFVLALAGVSVVASRGASTSAVE